MSPSIPAGIPLKIPVFSTLYLSRRGSEGQRLLRLDSLEKDAAKL